MNEVHLTGMIADLLKKTVEPFVFRKKNDGKIVEAKMTVSPFAVKTLEAFKSACPMTLIEPMDGDSRQMEYDDFATSVARVRIIVGIYYNEHDITADDKYKRLGIDLADVGQYELMNVLIAYREALLMNRFLGDGEKEFYELQIDREHPFVWDAVPNNINTAPYAFGMILAYYKGTDPVQVAELDEGFFEM